MANAQRNLAFLLLLLGGLTLAAPLLTLRNAPARHRTLPASPGAALYLVENEEFLTWRRRAGILVTIGCTAIFVGGVAGLLHFRPQTGLAVPTTVSERPAE